MYFKFDVTYSVTRALGFYDTGFRFFNKLNTLEFCMGVMHVAKLYLEISKLLDLYKCFFQINALYGFERVKPVGLAKTTLPRILWIDTIKSQSKTVPDNRPQ